MKPRTLLLFCLLLFFQSFTCWAQKKSVNSRIETVNIHTGERKIVKQFPYLVEAPNWTQDNQWLIYNSRGKLWKLSPHSPNEPIEVHTGFATRCNNDHVLSPDGKQLAISHATKEDGKSRIYTLSLLGGTPTLITPMAPSYLHGWSPDGEWLSYCAERNGNYDIYIIPTKGGEEVRLTTDEGLDDGPEYSPCGKYIWYNSVQSGLMQIWRMKADGSEQTQMTFDLKMNAWFPHVSPDGKWVVFIAYHKDDLKPDEHLANKNVELRIMSTNGGEVKVLTKLLGGQGTINVNSWSPDNEHIAFVSYELE